MPHFRSDHWQIPFYLLPSVNEATLCASYKWNPTIVCVCVVALADLQVSFLLHFKKLSSLIFKFILKIYVFICVSVSRCDFICTMGLQVYAL